MSITLAIESAVAGGSIAVLDGTAEIDHWLGRSDISRAEDILINIDELLGAHALARRDIALIAVAAGPGSFTGIRIGIATAIGLKNGLGVPMASVSALEAIADRSPGADVCVAVPMGRSTVCLQEFRNGKADDPAFTLDHQSFIERVAQDHQSRYVVHENLYTRDIHFERVTNFGANIAAAVGLLAIRNPDSATAPIFVSKAAG